MKAQIKQAGISLLSAPPVLRALRNRAMKGNPTTILCYHTLRPETEPLEAWTVLAVEAFEAQIAALRADYDIVSLPEALARQGEGGRPRVVLTFDDGEWGLYHHLLPIIEREEIPVTAYIATGQIATGQPYWFDRVMNALQGDGFPDLLVEINGRSQWPIDAPDGPERWMQINAILEAMKAEDEDTRDPLAERVIAKAGKRRLRHTPLQPMTVEELKSFAAHPLVTIGAHSHGHELLDRLPLERASASIAASKHWLEDTLGQPVTHFAYPNGNYSPALMAVLRELGFTSATILEDRLVRAGDDLMALPRIGVGRYDSLPRLMLRMAGV